MHMSLVDAYMKYFSGRNQDSMRTAVGQQFSEISDTPSPLLNRDIEVRNSCIDIYLRKGFGGEHEERCRAAICRQRLQHRQQVAQALAARRAGRDHHMLPAPGYVNGLQGSLIRLGTAESQHLTKWRCSRCAGCCRSPCWWRPLHAAQPARWQWPAGYEHDVIIRLGMEDTSRSTWSCSRGAGCWRWQCWRTPPHAAWPTLSRWPASTFQVSSRAARSR